MVIGYINSTWSMPRRLALISAIFLVPSLIQLSIYASNKMGDINIVEGEIAGANLARAVWEARGSPQGLPEEDWFRAERALKGQRESNTACFAG